MSFASDFFNEKKVIGKMLPYIKGQVLNFPLRTNFQRLGITQAVSPDDLARAREFDSKGLIKP